jgi:2,4-dienoyl-CoA reductase-like NADH-dependent reductase (Old Yellow Enzyme family)
MTEAEILEVIERFAATARRAEQAGFDGVELHGAHGYLISQFLSPLSNRRDDAWGGSLENRARFLLEIVRAIRAAVKPGFGVGVKLNSADFQRGGFDVADAQQVVRWLNELAVDLVEVSGGTYESPAMQGRTADQRTLAREAYFLEFARDIAAVATMPVMTTGGIRRREVAEAVLVEGVSLVGIATALALVPDLASQWRSANTPAPQQAVPPWKDKAMVAAATIALTRRQLQRMGRGANPTLGEAPLWALLSDRVRLKWLTRRYRRWLHQ